MKQIQQRLHHPEPETPVTIGSPDGIRLERLLVLHIHGQTLELTEHEADELRAALVPPTPPAPEPLA